MDHSTPPILLSPLEIKHHIVTELCSPNSLAAFARTHTSFQRVAEQALYHTLFIEIYGSISLTCLETLTENSEKATFVRSLMIKHDTNKNQRVTTFLTKALVNMHSLSDLRIKIHPNIKGWMKNLSNALCEGHFQLKTLYCDDILPQIIKSQTELQILGLYASGENLLKTLRHFHDAQLFPPTIFTLDCEFHSVITIFPAFYSVDRITTIHQLLAKSFDECQSYNDAWDDVNEVNDLSAYLIDCSDMPTIHALTKGIARCFPQIRYISFNFERRCEIPPHEMKEVLSLFSNLKAVLFYLWPGHNENVLLQNPKDIGVAHVKIWRAACPKLNLVRSFDGLLPDGLDLFRS